MLSHLPKLSAHHPQHEIVNHTTVESKSRGRSDSVLALGASNEVRLSSYLYKKSKTKHNYKKRWFVLRDCQLSWYKDSKEYKPRNVISINNLVSFNKLENENYLHNKGSLQKKFKFIIYSNKKKLKLYCQDEKTYNEWIQALDKLLDNTSTSSDEGIDNVPLEGLKIDTTESGAGFGPCSGADDFLSSVSDSPNTPYETARSFANPDLPRIKEHHDTDLVSVKNEIFIQDGTLEKQKAYNQWKTVKLVLTNKKLSMFKSKEEKPFQVFNLNDIIDITELEPLSKIRKWCFLLITREKRMKFSASNEEDLIRWLTAVKMLVAQRKKLEKKNGTN
ncbi:BA75_03882T0 [Komagataella pastoris]|uniref:BA75_03882T0 n=1 Tax=Komagataella pastoris TaxID=4922 RepID=A0A1B2JE08_PICPA|nr:BA75_03882T0 [Komagataella pastoris]